MKTIHIFYNGNEANFPPGNEWEEFHGHDSVRLFETCCESWRRNGWEVKRLSTLKKHGEFQPLEYTGRIRAEGGWYPWGNWQLIAKCCTLQPNDQNEIWIGSYDVMNYGYVASRESIFNLSQVVTTTDGVAYLTPPQCVSFQREHWSMAFFCATPEWFQHAREVLANYDAGVMPRIPGKYTSDETILRTYATGKTVFPLQAFPHSPDAERFPLIHFARSTLKGYYEKIPVV